MSGATTAAYLARRAAQKEKVRILYRRALKDTLNWAVHRHLFYQDTSDLREKFEANKHVEDLDTVDNMIAAGEATYNKGDNKGELGWAVTVAVRCDIVA